MFVELVLTLLVVITEMWQSVSDQQAAMSDLHLTIVWRTIIVRKHTINLGLRVHAETAEQFFSVNSCVVSVVSHKILEADIDDFSGSACP